eukprot:1168865-Prorocentrum_minimum.AAC.1
MAKSCIKVFKGGSAAGREDGCASVVCPSKCQSPGFARVVHISPSKSTCGDSAFQQNVNLAGLKAKQNDHPLSPLLALKP